jgi:hypothetical protein
MKSVKSFFIKIIILKNLLSVTYGEWKNQVWNNDIGSHFCCDGRECGCGGMTIREAYDPKYYQKRN